MTVTVESTCTSKALFRTYVVAAMNDLRSQGQEPSWQSVSRYIEQSGVLRPGDIRENPSADTGHTFQYVWQTTLSFTATDMKNDGILYREPGAPWILTEWGITTAQMTAEVQSRKIAAKTCPKCWCQHRTGIECF